MGAIKSTNAPGNGGLLTILLFFYQLQHTIQGSADRPFENKFGKVIKRSQRHIVAALASQDVMNMHPKAVVADHPLWPGWGFGTPVGDPLSPNIKEPQHLAELAFKTLDDYNGSPQPPNPTKIDLSNPKKPAASTVNNSIGIASDGTSQSAIASKNGAYLSQYPTIGTETTPSTTPTTPTTVTTPTTQTTPTTPSTQATTPTTSSSQNSQTTKAKTSDELGFNDKYQASQNKKARFRNPILDVQTGDPMSYSGIQIMNNQGMIYDAWLPENRKRRRRRALGKLLLKRVSATD